MRTRERLIELCLGLNPDVVGSHIMVGAQWAIAMMSGIRNRHGWAHLKFAIREAEARQLWWTHDMLRECRAASIR